jgi:DMSO/TMAO reductase YedYZ molybdopterin-dependent catalytic subunit
LSESLQARGKSPRLFPVPGDDSGLNLETPLGEIADQIVPTPLFFTRSNNPIPEVDPHTWRLSVRGLVGSPRSFSLAELKEIGERSQTSWLECAGNSRYRWDPGTPGNQWGDGAVGNAEFTGVTLATVIWEAGGADINRTQEIVFTGADPNFRRSLPLDDALDANVLVAWGMNGRPLLPAHGAPVRLVVPGWPGIASVKWLSDVELVRKPFSGRWQTDQYTLRNPEQRVLGPVREMPVKSVIAGPSANTTVARGERVRVWGFAWSGHGPITRVDFSTDGGHTWHNATLQPALGPLAWWRWELDWTPFRTGEAQLMTRATDARGNVQPEAAQWNALGYQMNAQPVVPILVR